MIINVEDILVDPQIPAVGIYVTSTERDVVTYTILHNINNVNRPLVIGCTHTTAPSKIKKWVNERGAHKLSKNERGVIKLRMI